MATQFTTLPQALQRVKALAKSQGSTMTAHPTRVGQNLFIPANERAALELAKSGGSLNAVANGRLIRISSSDKDWDIGTPWHGREITSWSRRTSLWDKMITISFYVELTSSAAKLPTFTLALTPPLTDEEVTRAAEVYMSLLNLARVQ
jgi:hypothetical protein